MSIGNTIHFLQVPYAEKDEAKALGARWNAERKQWYYYGEEDGRFEKWTPTPVMQLSDLSEEQQSMIALAKTGKNGRYFLFAGRTVSNPIIHTGR